MIELHQGVAILTSQKNTWLIPRTSGRPPNLFAGAPPRTHIPKQPLTAWDPAKGAALPQEFLVAVSYLVVLPEEVLRTLSNPLKHVVQCMVLPKGMNPKVSLEPDSKTN